MTFLGTVHRKRAAPSGPTTLFYDEFTDADGTPLDQHTPNIDVIGGGWTRYGSHLEIDGNKCRADTGFTTNAGVADVQSADIIITARLRHDATSNYRRGIAIRTQNSSSFLFFGFVSTNLTLRSDSSQYFNEAYNPGNGTWYDFKIECNGNNIKGFVDDIQECDETVSEYATITTHGVLLARRDVYIDDIRITTLT